MASTRCPISKEFFPFDHFTPPMSAAFARGAQKTMKVPGFIYREPDMNVHSGMIPAYDGGKIRVLVFSPKYDHRAVGAAGDAGTKDEAVGQAGRSPVPCLIDYHGGGFVLPASPSHYRMAMEYARQADCRVVFPLYRLAPDYPFPYPQEDAYAAFLWVCEHADDLGIDPDRIGVCGDSVGGALAVTTCLLAKERGCAIEPRFQLLIYPWLDGRNDSESWHRFTDTPMWNSELSVKVTPLIDPHPEEIPLVLRSPIEAGDFSGMPPAYIEVTEFDCLHDDGVLYARLLKETGIAVDFRETRGTMHGFDTKITAPTTRRMIAERAAYMRRLFQRR